MSEAYFWENLAYTLLEMNLNGDGLNKHIMGDLFKDKPEILAQLDFGEGVKVQDLDKHLYAGQPDIIDVRTAKPHELWECLPCGKTFRRKDNLDRHLRSALHARRLKVYSEKQAAVAEKTRENAEPEKTELTV